MKQKAKLWTESHRAQGLVGCRRLVNEVSRALSSINSAYETVRSQTQPQGAAEWLLDNRYLLLREGIDACRALRHAPKLPAVERLPRAFDLWLALTAEPVDLSEAWLDNCLSGGQQVEPLVEAELWLTVPLLKCALVLQAARVCDDLSDADERQTAMMRCAVSGLRWLSVTDLSPLLQRQSAVERLLSKDPSGVYAAMDEPSRADYRRRVTAAAHRQNKAEWQVAQALVEQAQQAAELPMRHVGYGLDDGARPWVGRWYGVALLVLPVALGVVVSWLGGSWWLGLVALLSLYGLCKRVVDAAALRLVPPRVVPRMDCRLGVPDEGRTLCVITALLGSAEQAAEAVRRLERYALANREPGRALMFGLLLDLPDADAAIVSGDADVLAAARREVALLNRRYGGGFYLFLRPRTCFQGTYMGRERKRGALLALCRLLRGREKELTADGATLPDGVRYVVTLDGDTRPEIGGLHQLIGAMLHPLNKAAVDAERGVVFAGHGLLLPRIGVELTSANASPFATLFGGCGGVDAYTGAVSDVYQDVFGRASFTGKGIVDVDAMLACLDGRLPDGRILSHDLLEGAYLRAGLVSDVVFHDGVPARAGNWFDRLHRWVRGDWQVARWLLPTVPTREGKRRNALDALNRFKILDNLLRSVEPLAALALLTLAALGGWRMACAAGGVLLLALLLPVVMQWPALWRRQSWQRDKLFGGGCDGVTAELWRSLLLLALLPYRAWVSVSAVVTALWRLCVSHRRLLQWTTSAEAEARRDSSLWGVAVRMWPNGLWVVALQPCCSWRTVALGILSLAAPVAAWLLSRSYRVESELPMRDRAFLLHQATLMWRYFDENLTAEHHYLPPDNIQEQPAVGVAARTSPTNIGLALLCAMAAVDLSLTSRDRALTLMSHILTTLERLPKWNGHIYNWYDTRTLQPLRPCLVSTVDSGNLVGYLLALGQGLREWGDDASLDLAERAEALAEATDLSALYDEKRKLFVIGFDIDNGKPTEGCYDLLTSEARQTSYLAVARGEVGVDHWKRLSRVLVGQDGYRGMASWTGTMFEYQMPHLLLPRYRRSLLDESCRFAVYVQRRHAARHGVPWGVSESCFYAFDASLNYQYKAHGVQRLAFKRGLGKELVVAPYASFLALVDACDAAVANLRRLAADGFEGQYGLIEAVDYTPARLQGSERAEAVRCYMSHHLGMSLLSVANRLCGDVFIKRLLSDSRMAAVTQLLQEKMPAGVAALRPSGPEVPEKPQLGDTTGFHREGTEVDADRPRLHLLSNGAYTLSLTDGGQQCASCNGLQLMRREPGVYWGWWHKGKLSSMTAAPDYDGQLRGWQFHGGQAVYTALLDGVQCRLSVCVPRNDTAQQFAVTVQAGEHDVEGELVCYFEPVLAPEQDFEAHPAFSKLFLQSGDDDRALLFSRRPRGDRQKQFLAVCSDAEGSYDTSREKALGRGGFSALAAALEQPAQHTRGCVLDPCLLMRVPVSLKAGGSVDVKLALAYASRRIDALAVARRVLAYQARPTGRIESVIRLLGMTTADAEAALELGAAVCYGGGDRQAVAQNRLGQRDLWPFGISGDVPIALLTVDDAALAKSVIKMHRFLALNGLAFDLVALTRDGSEYHRPGRGLVMTALKAMEAEHQLGVRGGVHVLDVEPGSPEWLLLRAVARVAIDGELPTVARQATRRDRRALPVPRAGAVLVERGGDGEVSIDTTAGLPPQAWSHVLANRAFGALVGETGLGHMWRRNARENQLTPWRNDLLACEHDEQLCVAWRDESVSLFAANDGWQCRVTYGPGFARYDKRRGEVSLVTTVFVPPRRMARLIMVELKGVERAELRYQARYCMGSGAAAERHVASAFDESCGTITVSNFYNKDYEKQWVRVGCSSPFGWFKGGGCEVRAGAELLGRAVLCVGCAQNEPGLATLAALCDWHEAERQLAETKAAWVAMTQGHRVECGGAMGHYLNGWALYQVAACRLFARTSQFQCGGAYGFRDQLQDSFALLDSRPELVKYQLLRAAAHQFEEGDVQHWWHEGNRQTGEGHKGVRTRCSDDLLWLAYGLCLYVEQTDDTALTEIKVPYLTSPVLGADEQERYELPRLSARRGTMLEHACRAAELVMARGTGERGLLLIGSGDWNDGFNRVGERGRGESVWLTWFAAFVLEKLAALCCRLGGEGADYRAAAQRLWAAGRAAWDGRWFLRGSYDDGAALGADGDAECCIDSIAQSFACLDAGGDRARQLQALESARERLVDYRHRYIRLFTPAFDEGARDPGYIKGYVPGVRENGGQYTHAAVWLAMGYALMGRRETALELLELLLPETHDGAEYKAEPYVLAADVYDNAEHRGRGGWSWYTGAAGWFYRIARGVIDDNLKL